MRRNGEGKGEESPSTDEVLLHGLLWLSHTRSEAQVDAFRALPGRPDDVFVATFPKCGTHWVHKLCCLILNVDRFNFPTEFNHWENGFVWTGKGAGKGDLPHCDIPSPRVMSTHVPVDFLPADALKLGCRIVYVLREPKDTLVSYYHFSCSNPWIKTPSSLEEFAETFLAGASLDRTIVTAAGAVQGGYAAHVMDYVKAARGGANIYIASYDRLQARPIEEITALAEFLGVHLSPEIAEEVRQKGSFSSMKAEAKGKEDAGQGLVPHDGKGFSDILYRKGERGDGAATLSEELARRTDQAFGKAFAPIAELFAVPELAS